MSDPQHMGCMLGNSSLKTAPHDPEFARVIADVLNRIESFFRRCVMAGQRAGTIAHAQTAPDLARLLLSTARGIHVLARVRPERALLHSVMRPVLGLLDAVA